MAYKYKTNAEKAHKAKAQSGRVAKTVCKKRMYGKPCKECNQVAKLAQSNDEDDKAIAAKVRAKSTYYMNVVPMSVERKNFIYPSGITNWRDMIALLPDSDGDGADFTDPDKARPIVLERKGKGRNTKYSLKLSENKVKVPEKFLNGMQPLHKVLDILDDDDKFWIPVEGKNKFLVMPPWGAEANGEFWFEAFFHWNTDLLGAASDMDDDGEESGAFSDDEFTETRDETFTDAGSDDSFDDDSDTDDFDEGDSAADDFDEFDEDAEKELTLDEMNKDQMVEFAKGKSIKLSSKALAASDGKLRTYLKKKTEDAPW